MTFPAKEITALHSMGAFRYSGIATIEHAVLAAANTLVQNQACLTILAFNKVGVINVSAPRSRIELFEMSW
jgi:hypothetical protein